MATRATNVTMKRRWAVGALSAFAALVAGCTSPPPPSGEGASGRAAARPTAEERLAAVIADPRRDGDRARDVYRHPAETLAFFGVEPDMVVADVLPGGGWYTRVLLPYVGEDGGYIGVAYGMTTAERQYGDRFTDERRVATAAFPETFVEEARGDGPEGANVMGAYLFDAIPSELDGSVDFVLFARALHHLKRTSTLNAAVLRTYEILKPGGVVGVVQHRAKPDASDEYASGNKGYVREADIIAAFEAAGFVFEEASEINANPNDPADWPNGVWTLPPRLALGLLNRDDYVAIGESDRMTLRFRKPE